MQRVNYKKIRIYFFGFIYLFFFRRGEQFSSLSPGAENLTFSSGGEKEPI
jgi:hypothetical protein